MPAGSETEHNMTVLRREGVQSTARVGIENPYCAHNRRRVAGPLNRADVEPPWHHDHPALLIA